jgi:hypothetical protein
MVRAANPKTRPQVLEILDSAKELGLTVLRIWAFSDGHLEWNALQRYPGRPALLLRGVVPGRKLVQGGPPGKGVLGGGCVATE